MSRVQLNPLFFFFSHCEQWEDNSFLLELLAGGRREGYVKRAVRKTIWI